MKKIDIKYKKAGMMIGIIGTFFIAGILILTELSPVVVVERRWQMVDIWTPIASEGNPGSGASGFLEIFFMNTSSADSLGYGLNTSSTHETWCSANMVGKTPYANADNFNVEIESEKTFVFMVRTRYNKTHVWDATKFIDTRADCQITVSSSNWAVGSNIANASGTKYITRNNTGEDYLWINWVWDNGGTGYQLADDGTITISEIYIEAEF